VLDQVLPGLPQTSTCTSHVSTHACIDDYLQIFRIELETGMVEKVAGDNVFDNTPGRRSLPSLPNFNSFDINSVGDVYICHDSGIGVVKNGQYSDVKTGYCTSIGFLSDNTVIYQDGKLFKTISKEDGNETIVFGADGDGSCENNTVATECHLTYEPFSLVVQPDDSFYFFCKYL